MSDVIDLDALVPPSTVVKIGDQEITVLPPKTATILRLNNVWAQINNSETTTPEAEYEKYVNELTELVIKCIPGLAGKELPSPILWRLVAIINEMAVPPDTKELEARGITVDDPKKAK